MDKDLWRLLIRYRWCKDLEVCIGCEKSLKYGGVVCSICQLFSYCSPNCLEQDITRHRPACETILYVKGAENVMPDYVLQKIKDLIYRAKLLDSEGDFISPAVIREAYLIKNSDLFLRNISALSMSDTRKCEDDGHDKRQKRIRENSLSLSVYSLLNGCFGRPLQLRSHNSMDIEGVKTASDTDQDSLLEDRVDGDSKHVLDDHKTHSTSTGQSGDCDKSQCKSSSACSHVNHSSVKVVSDKEVTVNKTQDAFGSGWWGKRKLSSSKKSTQEDKLKQAHGNKKIKGEESRHNQDSENHTFSNVTKDSAISDNGAEASNNSRSSGSSQTRKLSESNTFGSGWWQGNILGGSKTASSSAAKPQTLQHSVPVESKQQGAKSTTSVNALSNSRTNNSALGNNVYSNTSNNSTRSHDVHSNTSTRNNTVKNGAEAKPESETFGSGWWKHRAVDKKERPKPAKSKTDQTPKVGRQEPKQQNKTSTYIGNGCRDVVLYETKVTPAHNLRFAKVESRIASILIEEEANHGRQLVMGLILVPGMWQASLGGSRISLVVEIAFRYQNKEFPTIQIRDKHGHTADVLLRTNDSNLYRIPGTRNTLSVSISECLKPGTFIILRAVKWQELPSGRLVIEMLNMADVDFIFYELLA